MKRNSIVVLAVLLAGCGSTGEAPVTVSGYVHAGPMCAVQIEPPDPSCDDRPVSGAVIVVFNSAGVGVEEAVTGSDGTFTVHLTPGRYRFVPQPVEGLLGVAPEQEIVVRSAAATDPLDFAYDTGIR